MKNLSWTAVTLALVALAFALTLVLPLTRGETPVDLGLDLSGGVIVTYRPEPSSRLDAYRDLSEEELLALAKETLQSRLARSFSTFPDVVIRGDGTIVASIPARDDPNEVLERIGKTYHLTLRPVLDVGSAADDETFSYRGRELRLGPAAFSGDMLDPRSIRVETGVAGGAEIDASAKVAFRFRPPHDNSFETFTGDRVGRELAILLDDRVEWVGVISSAIPGSGVLAGGYGYDQAAEVAMMLRAGTLPIALEVESLSAVGPALGQELRDLGRESLLLAAALLATLVVVAYRHRRPLLIAGLVSLGSLLLFIAGLAAVFGLTLDLAGVAGIVLSIGMGMDAFILVFESLDARLRGMSAGGLAAHYRRIVRGAYSFAGAGRILFHANATTLLAVALLFGNDRLRSFAIFIFVGLLASFLTILVTREVLLRVGGPSPERRDLLAWLRRSRPRLFRLRRGYLATLAAALLVTAALLASGIPGGPRLELGDDFREGTQIVVTSPDEAVLEAALAELGTRHDGLETRRQRLGDEGSKRHLLTLGTVVAERTGAVAGDVAPAIDELARIFAAHGVTLESAESIDSRTSSRRLASSLWVFAGSFVLLALYFGLVQGLVDRLFAPARGALEPTPAATRLRVFAGILLALVLDVAAAAATLAWLRVPIDLAAVAAFLTVVGYSINDSVVLWGHVEARRAELRAGSARAGAGVALVASCVDRVLGRACLTSLSTLIPALTILAVGLAPLRGFAWVLVAGTVAGTLSSIFVVGSFAARALEREATARRATSAGEVPETMPVTSRVARRQRV